MWPTKQDWTKHLWFVKKKNHTQSNLLFDIIPNFSYLQKFGRNSLDGIVHYLGKNEFIDKMSGYVYRWDKTPTCDRCGAKLKYTGARSVRLAHAVHLFPHMMQHGVCYKCDEEMMKNKADDVKSGVIRVGYRKKARIFDVKKRPEDIYRRKYIWL